ncbi:fasciclin domain-containing protein [Leeuwenhoekiella marinoflava]|uniref:Uncaracterized surface protein containing fasciclin (FAS1) repeats n=2 Tax=Leeuwenhoekiella marinoflava TaxID=988 RepID=A0ABY1HTV2_9FLAO|nr:fasciclin domain-containing protein [Leeuwenhoekiella marinoflava]RXG28348.1 putative surface protein with fasciclin (FAS1) repeats [Leeuwenhoekiella marinoflava]SHF55451.1 Uncaracterized surface protein containing fasciclin (FAS1) repeats [Leeuwenhoekiella marinoflava DSM 3653]
MKKRNSLSTLFIALFIAATTVATAQETKMVGGAAMYPTKNIVENAVNSKDHTTLVAAVKAADLVETLQSEGPFTVLAPVNAAFDELPEGTVATLLKPENRPALQGVLTYHVIAGKHSAADIMKDIKEAGGTAEWTTVNGQKLWGMIDGNMVKIKDQAGNVATVTIADVNQSNGVIHVIDTVLLPEM